MMDLWIFNHAEYIWFKTKPMLLIGIKNRNILLLKEAIKRKEVDLKFWFKSAKKNSCFKCNL